MLVARNFNLEINGRNLKPLNAKQRSVSLKAGKVLVFIDIL